MIHYLNPNSIYTPREYLDQWFSNEDIVVVTDTDINDFNQNPNTKQLLNPWTEQQRIIDLTHNCMPDDFSTMMNNFELPGHRLILSADYTNWYHQKTNYFFFPLYFWAFNQRHPLWFGLEKTHFDAGFEKSKTIMCLNHNQPPHRIWLYDQFQKLGTIDRMIYTWKDQRTLDNDNFDRYRIGVHHPIYSECAVNLVTETEMRWCSLSEKSCKPFMAHQIPIIVGAPGCNQFLQDIGFDMFVDLVPWSTWDNEPDQELKLQMISEFVDDWVRRDSMLNDYYSVLPRVQRNKQYFHSQEFGKLIMQQMDQLNFEPA